MLVDTRTAGLQLMLAPDEIKRLVRRHEIPARQLPGGQIRFDTAELAGWIQTLSRPMSARGISLPVATGPQSH